MFVSLLAENFPEYHFFFIVIFFLMQQISMNKYSIRLKVFLSFIIKKPFWEKLNDFEQKSEHRIETSILMLSYRLPNITQFRNT